MQLTLNNESYSKMNAPAIKKKYSVNDYKFYMNDGIMKKFFILKFELDK